MATAVNLSASWQAPGPSQLNITDCNTVVEYYADQISIIGAGGFLNNSKLGDMGVALAFLDAMVPDEWPGSNPSTENEMIDYYQNLMMWYFRVWENTTLMSTPDYELVENNIQNLAYGCNLAICDKLEVKGDPDISGRGVSVAVIA